MNNYGITHRDTIHDLIRDVWEDSDLHHRQKLVMEDALSIALHASSSEFLDTEYVGEKLTRIKKEMDKL